MNFHSKSQGQWFKLRETSSYVKKKKMYGRVNRSLQREALDCMYSKGKGVSTGLLLKKNNNNNNCGSKSLHSLNTWKIWRFFQEFFATSKNDLATNMPLPHFSIVDDSETERLNKVSKSCDIETVLCQKWGSMTKIKGKQNNKPFWEVWNY